MIKKSVVKSEYRQPTKSLHIEWNRNRLEVFVSRIKFFKLGNELRISKCGLFFIMYLCAGILSLALSLSWSVLKNDVSGGFAIGAYVLGLSTAATIPLQSHHNKHCHCDQNDRECP